ncbi:MAG: fluoride efflux transporter CrcB [Calditrichia bacterium]
MNIIAIALGGAFGALCRYYISGIFYRWLPGDFPIGTLMVNVIGSFLLAFLMTLFSDKLIISPSVKSLLSIGFLGAFTTFSTFSYETLRLFQRGEFWLVASNIILNVALTLIFAWLGFVLAKQL